MNAIALRRFAAGAGISSFLALGYALSAQGLDAGLAAYRAGDFDLAFTLLKVGAKQGDTEAQYLLGSLYRMGKGTVQDEYAAFHWCKRAAGDGMLEAQYQLGMMYLQGEGVTSSDDEAMSWLWVAADRGHPRATEVMEYILNNDIAYGC